MMYLVIFVCIGLSSVLGFSSKFQTIRIDSLRRATLFHNRIQPKIRDTRFFAYEGVREDKELLKSPFTDIYIPTEQEDDEERLNCAHSSSFEACTIIDDLEILNGSTNVGKASLLDRFMSSYLGPRITLLSASCLYGTNFPLGALMNDAMPASASTCARMVIASLVLSPFIMKIKPSLIATTILAGCFTSLGYVSQSVALVDTSPATVSFLGAATVLVCPFLDVIVDKKPMGWKDAPQTWISAFLCLTGVFVLEFYDPAIGGLTVDFQNSIGIGDALALLQAFGFGTGIFLSGRMIRQNPDQSLPITSVLVAITAFWSMIWCFSDGWIGHTSGWESFILPNMFFDPSMTIITAAVAWTGIVSTSANFFIENIALGKVPSSEASIYLATEPLWAALFAAIMLGEKFGANDIYGGFLIIAACLISALKSSVVLDFFSPQDTQYTKTDDNYNIKN